MGSDGFVWKCDRERERELVVGKFWKEKKLGLPMPSTSLEAIFMMSLFIRLFTPFCVRLYREAGNIIVHIMNIVL